MSNYKKMYALLFNAITDSLRLLEKGSIPAAEYKLKLAQVRAENVFGRAAPFKTPIEPKHDLTVREQKRTIHKTDETE